MKISDKEVQKFQHYIFDWWKTNKRNLPWRQTHDPYRILVSEIMLQQTQVSRGLPKYIEFINIFPTIQSLAAASPASVLRIWKGMGYNRRALYLHQAARKIVEDFHGVFPKKEQELLVLPGLGRYTARAILVFAYKQDIAMVDTNIRQILTHHFFLDTPQPEKIIQEAADIMLPKGKSWEWHQALMDYGAMNASKWRNFEKSRRARNNKTPFRESNRYFRGRILDLVREKKWKEKVLVEQMSKQYRKTREFINIICKTLQKDGLISRSKTGIISLPE